MSNRAKEVTDLSELYNRPDQAADEIAIKTRIALREYAVLLVEHEVMHDLLTMAILRGAGAAA